MGAVGLEEYLEIKSVYGFEEEAGHLPSSHVSPTTREGTR